MGIVRWEENSPIPEVHVMYDKPAREVRLAVFQASTLPFDQGEDGPLAKVYSHLESKGYNPTLSRWKHKDPLSLQVKFKDAAERATIIAFAEQYSKKLKRAYVRHYDSDEPNLLDLKSRGFTLEDMVEFEKSLESAGFEISRDTNRYKSPFIQLTLSVDDPLLAGKVDSEITAETFAADLLEGSRVPIGKAVLPQRDPNPVIRAWNDFQTWRKAKPIQASAMIYQIGNTGQTLSGLARGNVGEFVNGLLWNLTNLDVGLGPRRRRSEKELVNDLIEDFTRKDGKIDLDKSAGFTTGTRKYGSLIADYLNWREAPGNDLGGKALLAIMAGFSAFMGSLKGKKTFELDEEGNVKLDSTGKPIQHSVKDIALLYDGAAAMLSYVPQTVFTPPRTGTAPIFDLGAISKPIVGAARKSDSPAVKKVVEGYDWVEKDPARATGKLMATRNIMHMAIAGYDIMAGLPMKMKEYRSKQALDAIKIFTQSGSKRSYYDELKAAFGIEKFVDNDGKLTNEAIIAKDSFVKEYEAKQAEKDALEKKLKKTKNTNERNSIGEQIKFADSYLSENDRKYDLALLIGSFDNKDKSKHTGIPFINRKEIPGSYKKLINRHEKKRTSPYNSLLEPGGNEEFMYKMALNRSLLDDTESSLKLPWFRMFYSVFNYLAAKEMQRVNLAEPPQLNEAGEHLDHNVFYREAAKKIVALLDETYGSDPNNKARNEAQLRAIHNFAANAFDEREIISSRIRDVTEIENNIARAINGKVSTRHAAAEETLGLHRSETKFDPIGNVRALSAKQLAEAKLH